MPADANWLQTSALVRFSQKPANGRAQAQAWGGWLLGTGLHLERAYGTALSQKPGLLWPNSHCPGRMMSALLNAGAGGILRDQSPFMVPGRTPRSKERGQIYNLENLISGRTLIDTLLTLIYAFY